jgi:hypothetical protein
MNEVRIKEFTHVRYIDSFLSPDDTNEKFTFVRKGLYKPKHIIWTGWIVLLMQCAMLPAVIVLLTCQQTSLPPRLIPFSITWWILVVVVLPVYCGTLLMVSQFFQLLFLPFYIHEYGISIDSICSQKKGFFISYTKKIYLNLNIRFEVKFDKDYKSKYLILPSPDDNFIQSYGKEYCIEIYRKNRLLCIIDSLFKDEVDLFLQTVQHNDCVQVQNLQIEADLTTIDYNNSNNHVANQEVQTSTLGIFDVCRFILTWVILAHLIFLPQTLFTTSWKEYRLNNVLQNYYTDDEIKSQNIHFVETYNRLLLSNGVQLSNYDHNYVSRLWKYLAFLSLGILVAVIILDVIFGKRNIVFMKWFMKEFNKPLKQNDLFVRKWQLKSTYKTTQNDVK